MRRKFVSTMVLFLVIGMLASPFRAVSAEVDNAIHIRSDGLVDPSLANITSSDNVTYTLIADVYTTVSVERDNIIFDGMDHVIQGSSAYGTDGITLNGRTNVTIKNTQIAEFWQGINILASSNINLTHNRVTDHYEGITLVSSSNNTIIENTVASNYDDAIYLERCSNNTISGNQILGSAVTNHDYGITLHDSSVNTVSGNNISDIEFGIGIQISSNNKINGNTISTTNQYALWLSSATSNTLLENNVTNNGVGVWLSDSSNNIFSHNNFINNTHQVQGGNTTNLWNDAYPLGGNYWSDYNGADSKSGQFQNQTGDDGIGDTPYIIDENNQDHYPFVHVIPEYASTIIIVLFMATTLITAIACKKQSRTLNNKES